MGKGYEWQRYFYPRPPRGGRPRTSRCACWTEFISIHALREEGDLRPGHLAGRSRFLSTPSARRATQHSHGLELLINISIHALREEGDETVETPSTDSTISIHALREEGDPQFC